jgi:hypothetical protein
MKPILPNKKKELTQQKQQNILYQEKALWYPKIAYFCHPKTNKEK